MHEIITHANEWFLRHLRALNVDFWVFVYQILHDVNVSVG